MNTFSKILNSLVDKDYIESRTGQKYNDKFKFIVLAFNFITGLLGLGVSIFMLSQYIGLEYITSLSISIIFVALFLVLLLVLFLLSLKILPAKTIVSKLKRINTFFILMVIYLLLSFTYLIKGDISKQRKTDVMEYRIDSNPDESFVLNIKNNEKGSQDKVMDDKEILSIPNYAVPISKWALDEKVTLISAIAMSLCGLTALFYMAGDFIILPIVVSILTMGQFAAYFIYYNRKRKKFSIFNNY